MSLTQFAMIEELAYLVKDNLPCKHLVLSMEEVFINFLQDDTSSDGMLELEPMNSYNRLLSHRLADIFGFAHESVGEGDERHLILERCQDTSIPPILVSDILEQYDEPQSGVMYHQLLKREEAPSVLKTKSPSVEYTLKEREAAYVAARERIFSVDLAHMREPTKQRPRNSPVVARRMIAHALGQQVNGCDQRIYVRDSKQYKGQSTCLTGQDRDKVNPDSNTMAHRDTFSPGQIMNPSCGKTKSSNHVCNAWSNRERKIPMEAAEKNSASISHSGRSRHGFNRDNLTEEHVGAARRMFAHALGLQQIKEGFVSKCRQTKPELSE